MTSTVVGLGACCELVHEDDHDLQYDVSEFAVLADGRRVVLHEERGFGMHGPASPWAYTDRESITAGVLTTVLPDDDDDGQEHPWEWLAGLLVRHGIAVTADELRAVPYTVELGRRLTLRLQETAHLRSAQPTAVSDGGADPP